MSKFTKARVSLACGLLLAGSLCLTACSSSNQPSQRETASAPQSDAPDTVVPSHSAPHPPTAVDHDGHNHSAAPAGGAPRVPAYASAKEAKNLPPTLPPAQFTGQTRAAYQAVSEIPRTIAQLPCYCYCDEAFGHKSLYSCFADTHASQCAVCVEEALLAYKLQKEDKLTPEQIRERITAEYGQQY